MASQDVDPYSVLGLTSAATAADITVAFRSRLQELYPDSRDAAALDEHHLQRLLTAYILLRRSHPTEPADGDASGARTTAGPPAGATRRVRE